jgi:uncharacterized membrane protein YtjA (UPF0391 family)
MTLVLKLHVRKVLTMRPFFTQKEIQKMLRLAIGFLIIALIAGLFGFGFISSSFMEAAKILFFVFLVIALISFLGGTLGNRYRQ